MRSRTDQQPASSLSRVESSRPTLVLGRPSQGRRSNPVWSRLATRVERPVNIDHKAPAGGIQRFRMKDDQKKLHPRMTRFIRDEMPKNVNDAHLMKAMNEAGKNVGANAKDYWADLAWGSGPKLDVVPLKKNVFGKFKPGTDVLKISKSKVEDFEKEKDSKKLPGHQLGLEGTVLHEYVHYLADGKEKDNEELGFEFEEKAYGLRLGGADSNIRNVLTARFPRGEWSVEVTGSEAGFEQQFQVVDADSGNGTYSGKVGTTAKVKKTSRESPQRWRIVIRYRETKSDPWKESQLRKIATTAGEHDDFIVRSEDWTDRDFNDLVLRVRRVKGP